MARLRRLRHNSVVRDLIRDTHLHSDDFVMPFFVIEGENQRIAIDAMPGIYQCSKDKLLIEVENYIKVGGKAGLFFGVPKSKDETASQAHQKNGVIQQAIALVKKEFPEFLIITDVCLCSYTSHGHCGVIEGQEVLNDPTIEILGKVAVSHVEAGADMVAPSDMMDLRVLQIRNDLDSHGFNHIPILSYAVKYASSYYGPFREAADSTPQFSDRKSYQMDPANKKEALREAKQDILEGADLIMVKPALAYLDIISMLKQELTVPIVAYNVSGEYSMVKAAASKGWINEKQVVLETMTSMKRAGANIIISYFAKDILEWIK